MFICLVFSFFFFFLLIRKMIRSMTLIRETIRTVTFLIRCTPNFQTPLHLFMTVKVGLQYIEIQGGNTWLKWKYSIVNCVDIC
jgi:hypothetical protein